MSTEKDDDNIYELDKFRSSTRHNQLILPPINLKSRNIFQVSNLKLNEAKSIKEVNKIIFPKSFK